MSQQTLGWKPLQIIHHYFPRDEKKMEAFIDANPGDGFVVNVKEPWNDPNDHAGYDTYLRQPEESGSMMNRDFQAVQRDGGSWKPIHPMR